MKRMLTIAILCLCITPADLDAAARADRAQFPQASWGLYYYASTSHLSGESRAKCEAALAFAVAGASQQPTIEQSVPAYVSEGLFRLDLASLRWDWRAWHKVVANYPYIDHGKLPLIVRADWLVVQFSDSTQSDAYSLLLYGKERITRDEFLKFWGVNNSVESHFGVITKKTPQSPNVAALRWIENRPTNTRGSAWGTRDSAEINLRSDPLQHLDGTFAHDAEEWLVAMPKRSTRTGEQGLLLAAALFDAKGNQQNEAPPSIVTDHHGFRGQSAIRNPGSCVSCHATGINPPASNELRDYVFSGVDIYATPKEKQQAIDRFHFTRPGKQIERDNQDFAIALAAINGLDGETNAECYVGTIDGYDRAVTLETAADELYIEPGELRLALAYYNNAGYQLGVRLSGLPHGKAMPRETWEETYLTARDAVNFWREAVK
jgi:hypothetical protein